MRGQILNKDTILTKLEPFFKTGVSINRAVGMFNENNVFGEYIARSTIQTWYEQDEQVRQKIEAWQDFGNVMSRHVWLNEVKNGNWKAAQAWMDKHDKEQMKTEPSTQQSSTQDIEIDYQDPELQELFHRQAEEILEFHSRKVVTN